MGLVWSDSPQSFRNRQVSGSSPLVGSILLILKCQFTDLGSAADAGLLSRDVPAKNLPQTIRHSNSTGNTRVRKSQIFVKSVVKKVVHSGEQTRVAKSVVSEHKICGRVAPNGINCGRRQLEIVPPGHPYRCSGCSNLFG